MKAERVGTAIIGGGIAGCAVAYYLAAEGETDILLVEAGELGSGSTGGSFGGVRQQFSTPLEIELSRRGLDFWRSAQRVFDSPVTWHANGYLFIDRKSTRLNSSHITISYAVFCLKKKKKTEILKHKNT